MKQTLLSVSIDHIATLRQARGTSYPEPVHGASVAELAGADGITVHLREDKRHIQDRDVYLLNHTIQTRLNLKMALSEEMVNFAQELGPHTVTLLPESADEVTTEGGLDVVADQARIAEAVAMLSERGIKVALFIDADTDQVDAAKAAGACAVSLHAGHYSEALDDEELQEELAEIVTAAEHAKSLDLFVSAGSGLHYHNVASISAVDAIDELVIGHSIVSRAMFDGMDSAVRDMKALLL